MKFGKELHRCSGDKDIQDGFQAAIFSNSSIHKIFIFDKTMVKFGVRPT